MSTYCAQVHPKEVKKMKNPLAVQILALSIQILALVVILLKK